MKKPAQMLLVESSLNDTAEEELDLRELLSILWQQRKLLIVPALVLASATLIVALVLPKEYTAKILLSSVENEGGSFGGGGSGGLSSMMSQYKGLASLAGLSMPEDQQKEESIALLKSTLITEAFIRQGNLLPVIYDNRWNAASKQWRQGDRVPTLWEGSQYFRKKLSSVTEDAKTGLIEVDVTWSDPVTAANWANGLVQLTNQYAQQKAVNMAKRHIAFLNQKAEQTPYVEEREGIFMIMQDQLTNEMIAEGTDEYALKVIDPAFPPEKADFPRPVLWTALALFAGLAIGCLVVLVRHNLGSEQKPDAHTDSNRGKASLAGEHGLVDSAATAMDQ